jgi:hypothetical protein
VPGHCAELGKVELLNEFIDLEHRLHAVDRLRNLTSTAFNRLARSSRLFILVNFTEGERAGQSDAIGFSETRAALDRYNVLEREYQGVADVVLVGASEQDAVKLAYTNYFSDATMFIRLLDTALEELRS